MREAEGARDRRRVLFAAEAVTLAHVLRPRALAEALDPARYEVHFASAPVYDSVLAGLAAKRWTLESVSPQEFMRSLVDGRPVYDEARLSRYVEHDLALLDEVRPDVVVGDFRLSLAVSAPLRKIPYFALTNAYWSPFTEMTRWPMPDMPMVRMFGEHIAGALLRPFVPVLFWQHGRPLARVRRRFGLPPIGDMLRAYTWGDETLYLDVPELVPLRPLPASHRFIGPASWDPPAPVPDWWDSPPEDRPIVYCTLGSSGRAERLAALLEALVQLPITVMVATAGRCERRALPPQVLAADYLPGSAAAARARLVISNGGSATGYQALAQGTPVLGLPTNLDQHLASHYIERSGAGRSMRGDRVTPGALAELVARMLDDARLRDAAQRVQSWFRGYRPGELLDARIRAWA